MTPRAAQGLVLETAGRNSKSVTEIIEHYKLHECIAGRLSPIFMKHTPWHQIAQPPRPRPSPYVWLTVDNTQINRYCRNLMHDCATEVLTEPLMMIQAVGYCCRPTVCQFF